MKHNVILQLNRNGFWTIGGDGFRDENIACDSLNHLFPIKFKDGGTYRVKFTKKKTKIPCCVKFSHDGCDIRHGEEWKTTTYAFDTLLQGAGITGGGVNIWIDFYISIEEIA